MAKKTKEEQPLSFDDFTASDDFFLEEEELEEEEVEEEEEEQVEEEEEETPKPKAKKKEKSSKKDSESEEESEEEEEEKPKKKSKKAAPKEKEEELEEEAEEVEEEEQEEEEIDPETATKFFEEVEKITGQQLNVDYKDVDPLSPQGVAMREAALKEAVVDNFLEELSNKFPQVYRALEHANNGGNPADLFTQTTARDYSKVELKEGDDTLAKEILREYYKSRGVKSDEKINKLIEADEDSTGGLIAEAKNALSELTEEQEEEKAEILENQRRKAEEEKKRDNILVTAIDEVLETRKLGSFKIVDRAEAKAFREFVHSNLRRAGDKYQLATTIDPSNLESILQYQFFQFKKGDLTKIVQQTAASKNAEKLRLKIKGEQGKTKKTTGGGDNTSKLSLRSFIND